MKIQKLDNESCTSVLELLGMNEEEIRCSRCSFMHHLDWYEQVRLKYRLMNLVSIFSEHTVVALILRLHEILQKTQGSPFWKTPHI